MSYQHTNSKGVTYYLKSVEVTLRGGKQQTIYFFVKDLETSKGIPVELPYGKEVIENRRNGFLMVRNKSEEHEEE